MNERDDLAAQWLKAGDNLTLRGLKLVVRGQEIIAERIEEAIRKLDSIAAELKQLRESKPEWPAGPR